MTHVDNPEVLRRVVAVVRLLAEINEAFIELAGVLRALPQASSVGHQYAIRKEERVGEDAFRVGMGDGFRVEWYADAEFVGRGALSFAEELAWHDGEWTIEAAVTTHDAEGEHSLFALPRRYAVDIDQLEAELRGQTQLLLRCREEALRRFR